MSHRVVPHPARAPIALIDPFEALDQAHIDVMDHLRLLQRLPEHLQAHGVDGAAREMACAICAFFGGAIKQHHRQEEREVFPALLRSGNVELIQHVHRLQQDHCWLDEDWLELSAPLQAVAAGYSGYDIDMLREGVSIFAALYHEHISLEESLVYPAARHHLAGERAAAERRSVAPPA